MRTPKTWTKGGLRDRAALKALARYPDIKLPASFPTIDGVLTQDGMTLGIIRAFETAGKTLPPVTGETQVAFIKEGKKMKDAKGFSTVGIGLRLLQGRKLKAGVLVDPATGKPAPGAHAIWIHPALQVDNSSIDKIYSEYRGWANSYYVNGWCTEVQIDALFQ